ncbi:MAG: hypothetical protein NTV34_18010 [Proteobacteria bacterium]|nr:hypothetical protein [Pseudomonadota bacterium]
MKDFRLKRTIMHGMPFGGFALGLCLAACSSGNFSASSKGPDPKRAANIEKKTDPSKTKPDGTTDPLKPDQANTVETPPDGLKVEEGKLDAYVGGDDKNYHIGDGSFTAGSACYSEVSATGLSGTKYFFSFAVTDDNVEVSASIDHICGIDLVSNSVQIKKDGVLIAGSKKLIAKGATSHSLNSFTANKGTYQIEVAASNLPESGYTSNNYDDFNVGKVHIKAGKPAIKPGVVTTSN